MSVDARLTAAQESYRQASAVVDATRTEMEAVTIQSYSVPAHEGIITAIMRARCGCEVCSLYTQLSTERTRLQRLFRVQEEILQKATTELVTAKAVLDALK